MSQVSFLALFQHFWNELVDGPVRLADVHANHGVDLLVVLVAERAQVTHFFAAQAGVADVVQLEGAVATDEAAVLLLQEMPAHAPPVF